MKQFLKNRYWIVFLGGLAILVLGYLAAGLRQIDFRPPRPIGLDNPDFDFSLEGVDQNIPQLPVWQQLIFWVMLAVLIILILSLLSKELRKKIITGMIRFVIIFLALSYALKYYREQVIPEGSSGPAVTNNTQPSVPPDVFYPPDVPPVYNYLISLALIAGVMGLIWWIWRMRAAASSSEALEEVFDIASETMEELSAGVQWRDAIVKCYVRMSAAVSAGRGLRRQLGMTPTEFAVRMEQAGLPGRAVTRLTSLFESVRYGSKNSDHEDVEEAEACLRDIMEACRGLG